MLVACAVAALAGVAIGTVAIGSLKRFGFLGLLAVSRLCRSWWRSSWTLARTSVG
jgi:hypothetical protein